MSIKFYKKDKLVEKDLPSWLKSEVYNENKGKFAIVWSLGFPTNIPCGRILQYPPERIYALAELLKTKKFKSPYRQSLRTQLDEWLENEDSDFVSPFSAKQWGTLNNPYTRRNTCRIMQNVRKLLVQTNVKN